MSDKPLSERVLEAAETLIEVSELYDYCDPEAADWSAWRLRNEHKHIEAATRENAELEVQVEALAKELLSIMWPRSDWDDSDLVDRGVWMDRARELIESGWRNEDVA